MPGHQKGFGVIEVIVSIATLCLIGALGWAAYDAYTSKSPTQDVSAYSAVNAQTPRGFTMYENSELGFSFAYPSEWGRLIDDWRLDDKLLLGASFDKKPSVSLVVAPADYRQSKSTPGDPDCAPIGFGTFSYIKTTDSEFSVNEELIREQNKHVVESYRNGDCAGTTLKGRVGLKLLGAQGVSLIYSNKTRAEYIDNEHAASIHQYQQKYAISKDFKSKFLSVINSFKKL